MKPPFLPSLAKAKEDLETTTARLLSAMSVAVRDSRDFIALKGTRDLSFFSHQVRYLTKVELLNDGFDADDWELEDIANSGICFSLPQYKVRVLKAAPGGEMPEPGDSERRRLFLEQRSEQMKLFVTNDEAADAILEPTHIVYLWESDSRDQFTGMWLVCPNGVGKHHFKEWIALDDAMGSELQVPPAPPTAPPPADIGYTRKAPEETRAAKRADQKIDKTGTES